MMCVQHMEKHGELTPSKGPVLVTGAGGGVGSVAIAILAARGYQVIASTGRVRVDIKTQETVTETFPTENLLEDTDA